MRTALYRLYGTHDELLYVGITWQALPDRMKGHAGAQPWWHEVRRATATWYEAREEADQAETEAIRAECPKYNKAKTQAPRTDLRRNEAIGITDPEEIFKSIHGYSPQEIHAAVAAGMLITEATHGERAATFARELVLCGVVPLHGDEAVAFVREIAQSLR